MTQRRVLWLMGLSLSGLLAAPPEISRAGVAANTPVTAASRRSHLRFEANYGQFPSRVRFASPGPNYTLYVAPREAIFRFRSSGQGSALPGRLPQLIEKPSGPVREAPAPEVRMRFLGTAGESTLTGVRRLRGVTNYLFGPNRSAWRRGIPSYERVLLEGVYPGVDVLYYGNEGRLEYDLVVHPGADPREIDLSFDGVDRVRIDGAGDLILCTPYGDFRWRKPVGHQQVNGLRRAVEVKYALKSRMRIGFEVARYDPGHVLTIDPILVYSTLLGGRSSDEATAVAVDRTGAVYIAGRSSSADFPIVGTQQQLTSGVFVTKLAPGGTELVYSTYLGGEACGGLALDATGSVYLAGRAIASGLPIVSALQAKYGGGYSDAFVAKLDPTGSSVVYCTYLGGSGADSANAIAVDGAGNAYVAGETDSPDLPTRNPLQPQLAGGRDGFIAKLSSTGTALLYATYLGGRASDAINAIATDREGTVYATGSAWSVDFPVVNARVATRGPGFADAFVAKLNAAGSVLLFSTWVTSEAWSAGLGIALDASGNLRIVGTSATQATVTSGGGLFGTGGGLTLSGQYPWALELDPGGTTVLSSRSRFGGTTANALAVDGGGNWHITGTSWGGLATVNALQPQYAGEGDAFVLKLDPAGTRLFATYLGGNKLDTGDAITVDLSGNVYVAGTTQSPDFPMMEALQASRSGSSDAWAVKIATTEDSGVCTLRCWASSPPLVLAGQPVMFSGSATQSNCSGVVTSDWDFGDASAHSSERVPSRAYSNPGEYTWTMRASSGAGACSRTGRIVVIPQPRLASGGVLNAASYTGDAVSPGEIVTIFGTGIGPATPATMELTADRQYAAKTLANTRVLFDRVAAPLLYVSSTQISAVVPYSVEGSSLWLKVEYNGFPSQDEWVKVTDAHPGIFTADSSGQGQAAALNEDGTLNSASNPARPGSIVALYATGLGQTDPPGADGKIVTAPYPKPVLPVSVLMDAFPVEVLYAGAAPGLVSGMFQVNARVPGNAAGSPLRAIGFGGLPLSFEPNRGQFAPGVRFASRGPGYALLLTEREAELILGGRQDGDKESAAGGLALQFGLRATRRGARIAGVDRLPGMSNYFRGSDPANWQTGIPNYAKVLVHEVYPGIDLLYHGPRGRLEYDFVVQPGADPGRIALSVRGADRTYIAATGDLVLETRLGEVRWTKPLAFQQDSRRGRRLVHAEYALRAEGGVGFTLGRYDPQLPLVIDPVLVYSAHLSVDGWDIAVDRSGNSYVTGQALRDWQTYPNSDVFVGKIDPEGRAFLYSTYFGGSDDDLGYGIAIDGAGAAYITGTTESDDFPLVKGFQPVHGARGLLERRRDAFVAKLAASGSELVYSSYLGGRGNDTGRWIAVDAAGNAYVIGTTESTDFPVVEPLMRDYPSHAVPSGAPFLTKVASSGSSLVYSTYLGEDGGGEGRAVAVDSSGNAYATGLSFKGIEGGVGWTRRPFAVKLNPAGSQALYNVSGCLPDDRSLLGCAMDLYGDAWDPYAIAIDAQGHAYLTGIGAGQTTSPGSLQPRSGGSDAFVAKLDPSGRRTAYFTFLGGSSRDAGAAIALDSSGAIYVAGNTQSADFPVVDALQSRYMGSGDDPWARSGDAFIARISPAGTRLEYSTYLGGTDQDWVEGLAVDLSGCAHLVGGTASRDFPVLDPDLEAGGSFSVWANKTWLAKISPADRAGGPVRTVLVVGDKQSNPVTIHVAAR